MDKKGLDLVWQQKRILVPTPELFYKKDKGTIDRCYSLRGGYIRDYNF